MKTITGICTGLVLLGLLCLTGTAAAQDEVAVTGDISPYDGPIGPDSPLYGLKLALEDMDESFTANETERVDKQMTHARLRLSEVRRSLDLNQNDTAQQALDNYWLKMNLTNATLARWGSNGTGLLHAQEMILKHQVVLEGLLATHPNNTGLLRAYNNSLRLEDRFAEKTAIRFNRTMEKNNQTIFRAIRLEQKEHNRTGWPDANATATTGVTQDNKGKGQDKDKGNKNAGSGPVTTITTAPSDTTTQQQVQGQGTPQDGQTGRGGGNAGGNAGGNTGKGPKNK